MKRKPIKNAIRLLYVILIFMTMHSCAIFNNSERSKDCDCPRWSRAVPAESYADETAS